MLYRALGENVYQFGPAAGSSPGIQLEMMVNVLGLSGLRNAYRSVLSAVGSSEISGASRWLDALLEPGARRATKRAESTAPATASRMNAQCLRIRCGSFLTAGRLGSCLVAVVRRLIRLGRRSGSVRGFHPVAETFFSRHIPVPDTGWRRSRGVTRARGTRLRL